MRPSRRWRAGMFALVGLPWVSFGCTRCQGVEPGSRGVAVVASPSTSASIAASSALAGSSSAPDTGAQASRCRELAQVVTLGNLYDHIGVELGGVVVDERGFFVGARVPKEQGSLVVRVPHDLAERADTGEGATADGGVGRAGGVERWFSSMIEGGRAPQLALGDGRLFVGTLGRSDKGWPLHVDSVAAAGQSQALFDVLEHIDESEWTSLVYPRGSGLLAAWDEVEPTSNRGQIMVRSVDGSSRVIAPSQGDATEPQWLSVPDGPTLLAWIAELEDSEAEDAEPSGGAVRTQRWVEAVAIEPQTGRPLGVPTVLTRQNGHVQTVGYRLTSAGLMLVVRDDERAGDGSSGRLTAVRVAIEGPKLTIKETSVVVDRDVAFGVPAIVSLGATTFCVHTREDDTTRLVPLFAASSVASEEPSLRGRQVIASWKDHLLTAAPHGGELVLRTLQCGEGPVAR